MMWKRKFRQGDRVLVKLWKRFTGTVHQVKGDEVYVLLDGSTVFRYHCSSLTLRMMQ